MLEQSALDDVITAVAAEAGLDLAPLPEDVELIRREDCAVVLNHGAEPATVRVDGRDLEVASEDLMVIRP